MAGVAAMADARRADRARGWALSDEQRHMAREPRHWRDRAEEARAMADQMHDPETKRQMREIAEGYEKLAERAERRLAEPM